MFSLTNWSLEAMSLELTNVCPQSMSQYFIQILSHITTIVFNLKGLSLLGRDVINTLYFSLLLSVPSVLSSIHNTEGIISICLLSQS